MFCTYRFSLEANATLPQNPSATGCLSITKTSFGGCSLREQSPASWSGSWTKAQHCCSSWNTILLGPAPIQFCSRWAGLEGCTHRLILLLCSGAPQGSVWGPLIVSIYFLRDIIHWYLLVQESSCGTSTLIIYLFFYLSDWGHCYSLSFLWEQWLQPRWKCNPQLMLPVSSACRIR